MITIDGSHGEGGGQVLRTALSLSMITGSALTVNNIRAKRRKPGLMRQHLTAVAAAASICQGDTDGATPGSDRLEFRPGSVRHGTYRFAIGTAGSATLVLQTILPPLLATEGESEITLEGGTHNPLAPPFDFLERAFVPMLRRMGGRVEVRLDRHGFYPAGGGRIHVRVAGGSLRPLTAFRAPGDVALRARCLYACLPASIARREALVLENELPGLGKPVAMELVDSAGPGNAVLVDVGVPDGSGAFFTEVVTSFGEKGLSAEAVAARAARWVREFTASGAAVGKHLADQLLLPLALAGGGTFSTPPPSLHTRTNITVIESFLPLRFTIQEGENGLFTITASE